MIINEYCSTVYNLKASKISYQNVVNRLNKALKCEFLTNNKTSNKLKLKHFDLLFFLFLLFH